MKHTITMITGGHGSGKTAMALRLADHYQSKTYIATAEPIDDEMNKKILRHREERDNTYATEEVPLELAKAVQKKYGTGLIIIDCLTVWLNNILYYEKDAEDYIREFCGVLPNIAEDLIMITNESGMSLIPADTISRRYMRLLSELNKAVAKAADNVYLMASGIAIKIK